MAYSVIARCPACQGEDGLIIGAWRSVRGYCLCAACHSIQGIPLTPSPTPRCPGCGRQILDSEMLDWSGWIPRWGQSEAARAEEAPFCPRCGAARIVCEMSAHLNLGTDHADPFGPWRGQDTMEQAIFVRTLGAICSQYGLVLDEWLAWYGLDSSDGLAKAVGMSETLQYEIEMQMQRAASAEGACFTRAARFLEHGRKEREEWKRQIHAQWARQSWWARCSRRIHDGVEDVVLRLLEVVLRRCGKL